VILGTVAYSPGRRAAGVLDKRTTSGRLVASYEMLTGHTAFGGDRPDRLLEFWTIRTGAACRPARRRSASVAVPRKGSAPTPRHRRCRIEIEEAP
jgi:hypothetical protein